MLKINLAGFNVDADVLKELHAKDPQRKDITPEILSAAYARISRDPRPVDELRKVARQEVEKARNSNRKIIFQMGHHSVAEHAVFNFDIIGISRFAMEELEKFRLCSFTEKSQRYITLTDAYVIPQEIRNTPHEKSFTALIERQFALYQKLFIDLKSYVFQKNADTAQDQKKHALLEGWAKEDARYITPLATEAQLGFTVNARNLELIMRRFASHPLQEVQLIGRELYRLVQDIAPSIILFHQSNDLDTKTYSELKDFTKDILPALKSTAGDETVNLMYYNPYADDIIVNALLHTVTSLPASDIMSAVKNIDPDSKKEVIKQALKYVEFYDTLPREFEYVDALFELSVSAACFGQIKRHRMATITAQPYNPDVGIVIPDAIKQVGLEEEFTDLIKKTNLLYAQLIREIPLAASYILTNAHKKRILMKINAREFYHMSRLREDTHAQWDIRRVTAEMSEKLKKVMPLTMLLVGGKNAYHEIYKKVYGTNPKISLPEHS